MNKNVTNNQLVYQYVFIKQKSFLSIKKTDRTL